MSLPLQGETFWISFSTFLFPFALPPTTKPLNPTLTRPAPDSYSSRSTKLKALHQGSVLESFPLIPQCSPNPPRPSQHSGNYQGTGSENTPWEDFELTGPRQVHTRESCQWSDHRESRNLSADGQKLGPRTGSAVNNRGSHKLQV